ncbi:MAG: polysaccharide deacetylase family protein [Prolixibacteraceae bacterium]|nr:polysaccharide deacetylase family protein [Prolixibacteraceae bacterium]
MTGPLKNIIALTGNLLPFSLLRLGKHLPPFLPFYHTVDDIKPEYIDSYTVKTTVQFEKELDYLLKHFEPVDLKTVIEHPRKNQFHLSFDDGLKTCHTVIAPILKRKGIPATFFINTGFVDNKQLFHRFKKTLLAKQGIDSDKKLFTQQNDLDKLASENKISFAEFLKDATPYMTHDEILSLKNDGFLIGSHSIDHPEFWEITEEEQFRQIAESMAYIEKHFNQGLRVFSFPFTDQGVKSSLFDKLKKENIVDYTFGTAGLKNDHIPFNYQRVPVESFQKWSIRKVVHFEYFYFFVRSLFGKNIVVR